MAIAKDLHSNFYFLQIPIYFQEKSSNLVELSFSLSELWVKTSNPPGRIGLKFGVSQTKEKPLGVGSTPPPPLVKEGLNNLSKALLQG